VKKKINKRVAKNIISVIMLLLIVITTVFITKFTSGTGKSLLESFRDDVRSRFSVENTTSSRSEETNKSNTSNKTKNPFEGFTKNAQESDYEPVVLVRVVDGDTIIVKKSDNSEVRVRMIGVDTPESVNPDESKNTEEGKIASNYTKSMLIEGNTYYLEYDVSPTDKYGRTLAYVWLNDNPEHKADKDYIVENMYNAKLLANGYAKTMKVPPNTKYADIFKEIEKENSANHGAWLFPNTSGYIHPFLFDFDFSKFNFHFFGDAWKNFKLYPLR